MNTIISIIKTYWLYIAIAIGAYFLFFRKKSRKRVRHHIRRSVASRRVRRRRSSITSIALPSVRRITRRRRSGGMPGNFRRRIGNTVYTSRKSWAAKMQSLRKRKAA